MQVNDPPYSRYSHYDTDVAVHGTGKPSHCGSSRASGQPCSRVGTDPRQVHLYSVHINQPARGGSLLAMPHCRFEFNTVSTCGSGPCFLHIQVEAVALQGLHKTSDTSRQVTYSLNSRIHEDIPRSSTVQHQLLWCSGINSLSVCMRSRVRTSNPQVIMMHNF